MKNIMRVLLFPVAFYLAIYWTAYEIFWWAVIEEDSKWTRSLNGGAGVKNPIQDFAEMFRPSKR